MAPANGEAAVKEAASIVSELTNIDPNFVAAELNDWVSSRL